MCAEEGLIRDFDAADLRDAEIVSVTEDGDSVSVTLRRARHHGRQAGRATPSVCVRFDHVKDVDARRETRMTVSSLVEMPGEPPWRRYAFVTADGEPSRSLEVWARGVEWSDVERHPCPCCGYPTLDDPPPGTHEICDACGWHDDDVQSRDPSFAGGPNRGQSLRQRRAAFDDELANDPAKERALTEEWGPRAELPRTSGRNRSGGRPGNRGSRR